MYRNLPETAGKHHKRIAAAMRKQTYADTETVMEMDSMELQVLVAENWPFSLHSLR